MSLRFNYSVIRKLPLTIPSTALLLLLYSFRLAYCQTTEKDKGSDNRRKAMTGKEYEIVFSNEEQAYASVLSAVTEYRKTGGILWH